MSENYYLIAHHWIIWNYTFVVYS